MIHDLTNSIIALTDKEQLKEAREVLSSLSRQQVLQLTSIMYAGRGDATDEDGTVDFDWMYAHCASTFQNKEWAVSQMLGKGPLPKYLQKGLDLASRFSVDLDALGRPEAGE